MAEIGEQARDPDPADARSEPRLTPGELVAGCRGGGHSRGESGSRHAQSISPAQRENHSTFSPSHGFTQVIIDRQRADRARCEFEQFVSGSADELLRTGYLLAWDLAEAEDLVQECLFRVAKRWPRVRSMDHPTASARRILINVALDGAKRRSRQRQELDGGSLEDRVDEKSSRDLGRVDAKSELLSVLGALPPRQRMTLVLRYFLDLSEAEVASVVGCSLGTVKSTTSRGLARLEQELRPRQAELAQQPDETRSGQR